MKKDETFEFEVKIELWKISFGVLFDKTVLKCFKRNKLLKDFKRCDETNQQAEQYLRDCGGLFWVKDGNIYLFFEYDVEPNRIAHEAFHLTCHIMDIRGVKLSPDSEEVFAYTLDLIVKTILELKSELNS